MLRRLVEMIIHILQELINTDVFRFIRLPMAAQFCQELSDMLDDIEQFEADIRAVIAENQQ